MRYDRIGTTRIGDTRAAVALFAPDLGGLPREELRIAYLDRDMQLLMMRGVPGMGEEGVELPLRTVIHDALRLGAAGLILAHNHPSGQVDPSAADRTATRRLMEIARPLDIQVIDHLIFAGDAVASFRTLGLL